MNDYNGMHGKALELHGNNLVFDLNHEENTVILHVARQLKYKRLYSHETFIPSEWNAVLRLLVFSKISSWFFQDLNQASFPCQCNDRRKYSG